MRQTDSKMQRHLEVEQPDLFEANGWFSDKRLFLSVAELSSDAKVRGLLAALGIRYVGQVVVQSRAQLLRVKSYGRRTVAMLEEALLPFGLTLGMNVPEWRGLSSEDIENEFQHNVREAASWIARRKHKGKIAHLEEELAFLRTQAGEARKKRSKI
jgi:hypothetical protein